MRDISVDVLVVGAGPAGSVAARHAALGGAKTLMIEKRQEIGSPVRCGEGIARAWLEELGIRPDPRWISHEVKGARIISPGGHVVTLTEKLAGNECGYVIERDRFDRALAEEAAEAGADVMVKTSAVGVIRRDGRVAGVRARHMGEGFDILARVVVGADGFESQLGRWAGIDTSLKPSDVNVCFEYTLKHIDINPDFNDFYIGSCAPGGYIWVFVKGPDSANVGIGVQLSKIRSGERGAAKRYLDAFIARRPELAKGSPIREIAGAVSCCQPLERVTADGIMLVGDAARQIDPLTGGGVANACRAGKVAGEVAAEAARTGDASGRFLQKYERGWRAVFEDQMYRNWMAKEKLVTLSDETFDKACEVLASAELERVNTIEILRLIQRRYPELIKEFEDLIH
ncbi:MAG: geranylgeranyl reductase family protein [Thermoplasmatota archaeon]